jgi:hypothetical protein
LKPAIQRGVTVIAAHCGTRSAPFENDYVDQFVGMCHEHEHFYGDTAALNLPTRSHAYRAIFEDDVVRSKLVHGSDWPIPVIPPATIMGMTDSAEMWMEANWLRRDVLVKRRLGFDDAYWNRAWGILKRSLPRTPVSERVSEDPDGPVLQQG